MSRNKRGWLLRQRIVTKDDTKLLRAIGSTVADYREAIGITQTELGARVKVSRFQMSKHESGAAEMPVTRLFNICKQLQITPLNFLKELDKTLKKRAQ